MIGPTWLAAILGVVMIVAAGTAVARIAVAWKTHRATDYEVDFHNVVMGISMAGMLIPSRLIVTPGPSTTIWLAVWTLITIWFGVSAIRDVSRRRTGRRFTGHHFPHLVMSAAMIYMFAVMASGGVGRASQMGGMSGMGATSGLVPLPTLDYALVVFMVGYAVIVIDRLPEIGVVGTGDITIVGHVPASARPGPLAPRTAAANNIVMALVMGYMLTMMFV
jgi:hypothetical protein